MFRERKGFDWLHNWHHAAICDALMRVYRGECKRLIINVPPRYSKTELAVVMFIAWCLGQVPDSEFIHCSYSADLAANNSGNVRTLVQHEAYREVFPEFGLSGTAQAHWKTTREGVMYAAGTGGTLTGFGAGKMRPGFGGAIIIDDPHKASEARSEVIRQGVIDWFQDTLESRKNGPETPIIVIMQRLHENDLSGWLLAGGNGEQWEHLCLSAIQKDDDGKEFALWPAKHPLEKLREMERAAPYTFSGQYRQLPTPPEGGVFRPDGILVEDYLPFVTEWVRGWDFAATEDDGDWTVGGLLGKTDIGRFCIGDVVRFQGGPDEVQTKVKATAQRDGYGVRISLPQDPGQAGKAQISAFAKLLAGWTVNASLESGDKVTRAEPFAAQVNLGNVSMLRGDWNDAMVKELRNFPNGTFDDQVDALSRAFNELIGNSGWAFGTLQ